MIKKINGKITVSASAKINKNVRVATVQEVNKVIEGVNDEFTQIREEIGQIPVPGRTGWAQYKDTYHDSNSPLVILSSDQFPLFNNAGSTVTSQLNSSSDFYDPNTQKITPEKSGDFYLISIRFKAYSTQINDNLTLSLDIGGTQGIIIEETQMLVKGAGTPQGFGITFPIYALDTFKANGGSLLITAGAGELSVYDIVYVINRTHESIL